MKKLSLLAPFVLAAPLLVGCGFSSSSSSENESPSVNDEMVAVPTTTFELDNRSGVYYM